MIDSNSSSHRPLPSTRRQVLCALAALPVAAGCSRPRTRAEVVAALSRDLPLEDLAALDVANAQLVRSMELATRTPAAAELNAARAAFREALLAWERAASFPSTTLTSSHALLRALYWPIRTGAVQQLALENAPLQARRVAELGVDRKGIFALEFLLFGGAGMPQQPLVEAPGARGTRARALCLAFAENIAACPKGTSDVGSEAPADTDAMLLRILSHISTTIGSMSSGRMSKALLAPEDLRPAEIRGYASGMSRSMLLTRVTGSERVYLGKAGVGLATLVAQAAPDADRDLRARFAAAVRALALVREASAPVELLAAARTAVRSLDDAIETQLPSALGVALLFNGNDAD